MDAGTSRAMPQDEAHFEPGVAPNADGRYRALFENPFVGVELVGVDGRLIEVNCRLREMLGFARDELLGMHFEELSHPDDVPAERGPDPAAGRRRGVLLPHGEAGAPPRRRLSLGRD